jgi:hypothetical protein
VCFLRHVGMVQSQRPEDSDVISEQHIRTYGMAVVW